MGSNMAFLLCRAVAETRSYAKDHTLRFEDLHFQVLGLNLCMFLLDLGLEACRAYSV